MTLPKLAAWQDAFTAYLQNDRGEAALSAQIRAQRIAPAIRLDVYRTAYYARLEEALAHDFPALLAALGNHDFGRLMAEYLRAHLSTSPTLRDLGHALPLWLRARGKAQHADLAALEWAVLVAFDAADAPLLDEEILRRITPENWATLGVRLHPSLTLLALNSNAAAYWQARKISSSSPAFVATVTHWLVVVRSPSGPVWVSITENQHAVLTRLQRGETIATICAETVTHVTPREIPAHVAKILAGAVASGWVSAISRPSK